MDFDAALANRCYMQVVHPKTDSVEVMHIGEWPKGQRFTFGDSPAYRYEMLCLRFGSERVNRAIRNRILSNQFWRACVEERQRRGERRRPGRRAANQVREPALR
jgi:hypothetical protein